MPNSELTATYRTIAVCTEIEQERLRQINQEGHRPEDDDTYRGPILLRAALAYASRSTWPEDLNRETVPEGWPWAPEWWKPGLPRRMLIKAAALIVAHIEVLDRAAEREQRQIEDDAGAVEGGA